MSVVISNYNYGRYLGEAINSVLGQTYKEIEIIVVDDGSTDNSREVLESLNNPRFRVIYQDNSGQAAALNSGFRECHGEFIAFLDSDDFWFKEKLEISIAAFDLGNISVVQHNMQVVGRESEPSGGIHPNLMHGRKSLLDSYFKENHTGFFVPTSGIICRKDELNKIFPIDLSWKLCADVAITRPLPIFGDVVTLNEILGAYRIHGHNQWMNTVGQENWLANQQKYVDYTNSWLDRYGIKKRIAFERSDLYLKYRIKCGLPIPVGMKMKYWAKKALRRIAQ